MNAFNGKCRFRVMPAPRPLDRFSKKSSQSITSGTPPHMQVVGWKGACLRMREIITLRRLFFLFLGFMHLTTGRPIGLIVAVNGSNDAPWWPLLPFYDFVNKKNIFPYFLTQKCEKLHYTLWELWTTITLASLKIRTSCLHQTGGFLGRTIKWCHSNLPHIDPCCHGNQS